MVAVSQGPDVVVVQERAFAAQLVRVRPTRSLSEPLRGYLDSLEGSNYDLYQEFASRLGTLGDDRYH